MSFDNKILSRSEALSHIDLWQKEVLCLYGGHYGILTNWYEGRGAYVIAVDKDFSLYHPKTSKIIVSDVIKFLNNYFNNHICVLDIDPYGDPLPALRKFLENNNYAEYIALTSGMVSNRRAMRMGIKRTDWYKRYYLDKFIYDVMGLLDERGLYGDCINSVFSYNGNAVYAIFQTKKRK